jgi:ketosteroid isomerase-like protein
MNRDTALQRLQRLHEAQGLFYAGGSGDAVRELLAEDVVWRVPGENAIAGVYEGVEAVMEYFARRRDLASKTFRMHPGEVLVGDGEYVAVLTDGTAVVGGEERRWSTVGLYRFRGERVAACWLLPLDPSEFDRIWSKD